MSVVIYSIRSSYFFYLRSLALKGTVQQEFRPPVFFITPCSALFVVGVERVPRAVHGDPVGLHGEEGGL